MSLGDLMARRMMDKQISRQARLASDDLDPMKRAKLERKVAKFDGRFPEASAALQATPRMGMMGASGMAENIARRSGAAPTMKKGGKVKKMAKGGSTASKRADGCATKGKTRGKMV